MSAIQEKKPFLEGPLERSVSEAGSNSPTVAQVRALVCLFNGGAVPEDVKNAVLAQAIREEKTLRQNFDLWEEAGRLGQSSHKEIREISIIQLINSMSISYGEMSQDDIQVRKTHLYESMIVAVLEESK